jgi:hypothetical protein
VRGVRVGQTEILNKRVLPSSGSSPRRKGLKERHDLNLSAEWFRAAVKSWAF